MYTGIKKEKTLTKIKGFDELIDGLPSIAIYKGVGGECYVFDTGNNVKEEVLLDTGEIVKGDARVMWSGDIKGFKRALKLCLGYGTVYLGKGVVHKL